MSFILDALKKAESERHRASGPVLVDVHIAPPRRGLPAWAWVLGLVLLVNLALLACLMLRAPASGGVIATTATQPASRAAAQPGAATLRASAPAVPPPLPVPGSAPATDSDNLPTLQELLASGVSLPPLLLNLHVYDPSPALRYVLLNGMRLTEGDLTPDGIKVDAITQRGVVLEASGRRFLLPAGG